MQKTNGEVTANNSYPKYKASMRRMRKELKMLKKMVTVLGIVAVGFLATNIATLSSYKEVDNKLEALEEELVVIVDDQKQYEKEYKAMELYAKDCEDTIVVLTDNLAEAEDQNIQLYEENQDLNRAVTELQERQQKYDRYSYALFDTGGKRNDITYEQLLLIEDLCSNKRVDADLVLSIIMVESEGDETCTNKKSTARGYGQFLKGTGQWVYETLMGNPKGSYNHNMALNGDTNLRMMVAYLNYLYGRYNSTDTVINCYRGVKDSAYKNKLNSYLKHVGKSLSTV